MTKIFLAQGESFVLNEMRVRVDGMKYALAPEVLINRLLKQNKTPVLVGRFYQADGKFACVYVDPESGRYWYDDAELK